MGLLDYFKRICLAWVSAGIAGAICVWRGHMQLDSAHPSSLFNLLRHKCGILLVLCVLWLWFEAVRMVISPAGFRNTIRWPRGYWERR